MFEHCEYNPFTLTGRPSNAVNGINYAALNKSDGSRQRFISRHDKGFLIEIDLSGFHLYLLYTILQIPFPKHIYEELSKVYFKTKEPSDEQIHQGKELTFRQIYGGIEDQYLHLSPFKEIDRLAEQTFQRYKSNVGLKTFLFDRKVHFKEGLGKWKVFNYMLQNLETEFNAELLHSINEFLSDKSSKLILYTYDSFLIDYNPIDDCIKGLMNLFTNIPMHVKAGYDYHNLIAMKLNP